MTARDPRQALTVFLTFLRLGCTSFGGPIAHLGYFRKTFVGALGWLDDATFSEIVAMCSVTPGATSSKVGISIGFYRAGLPGALAAWTAFTAPSAIALVLFALGVPAAGAGIGFIHGLIVAAVAVVAQAVWAMSRTLCPDWPRRILALASAALALFVAGSVGQLAPIVLGGIVGVFAFRSSRRDGRARPRSRHPALGRDRRRRRLRPAVRRLAAGCAARPRAAGVRCVLHRRVARLRWRPRRAAAAPGAGRHAGLGVSRPLHRRLRGRPGGARDRCSPSPRTSAR